MSLKLKSLVAMAVAAVLSSSISAQGVITEKNLSLSMAQAIANGAIEKCQQLGYKTSVTVVNRAGFAIVMLHGDGANLHTSESSDRKAYTARTFRAPSADLERRAHNNESVALGQKAYTRVIALAGGLPIKVGDDVIGAVGVSGTPGKDDVCAQAGIDKVADQLK
jgi:uncharacterized protein GlcG (DUF336 family)